MACLKGRADDQSFAAWTLCSPFARRSGSGNCFCDPQTFGGLLVACAANGAEALRDTIIGAGYPAARIIGEVRDGESCVVVEA